MLERKTNEFTAASEFLADYKKSSNDFLSQEHYSPNTKDAYRHDINRFREFLIQEHVDSWGDINIDFLKQFILEQKNAGFSFRSVARNVAAVRTFFRYVKKDDNLLSENLMTNLGPDLKHTKQLSESELRLIEKKASLREKIIIGLLKNRVTPSEIALLKVENIQRDLSTGEYNISILHSIDSPHKPKSIHFDSKYSQYLENYIKQEKIEDNVQFSLIGNLHRSKHIPITRQGIWLIVHNLGKKCKLDVNSRNFLNINN